MAEHGITGSAIVFDIEEDKDFIYWIEKEKSKFIDRILGSL
ncbi:MAG: hypothetical protein RBS82_07735 [Syntrophales bacterium]|nr:hypothetical protein [Syntrophales bacterium]